MHFYPHFHGAFDLYVVMCVKLSSCLLADKGFHSCTPTLSTLSCKHLKGDRWTEKEREKWRQIINTDNSVINCMYTFPGQVSLTMSARLHFKILHEKGASGERGITCQQAISFFFSHLSMCVLFLLHLCYSSWPFDKHYSVLSGYII